MITTIFKKSTPINYGLVGILMIVFFCISQFSIYSLSFSVQETLPKVGNLFLLIATVIVANFITKKNALSKDSSFTVFFYFLFFIFFASVFSNSNLLIANLLVILGVRRLMALQNMNAVKEKIFDASLLIFTASLFYFWSILFLLMVFAAIILHVSRDYRNWILPFIAFFAIVISFVFFSLVIDKELISVFLSKINVGFTIDYFKSIYENISFSLFLTIALFFMSMLILTLSKRPLAMNSSYKKLIVWFFIGIVVFIFAPVKSNEILIFTFAPLSIVATSFIEYIQIKWQQELTLGLVVLCSFFCFFAQL